MKSFKKLVSLSMATLMIVSVFLGTTAFAAITDPSLWFGEDFQDDTVDAAYSAYDDNKFRNAGNGTNTVMQDSDSLNKYLRLTKQVRFGQVNEAVFGAYLTGRGGSNTWVFEFDFRLPELTSESKQILQLRLNQQSKESLYFNGSKAYIDSTEISGYTVSADKWMHFTFMNAAQGYRVYLDGILLAQSTGTAMVADGIWLFAENVNYDVDNFNAYAFTNGAVTQAVADAGLCSTGRETTARLDAAVAALVDAENAAVSTSATATADYTDEIAKVNTVIEQYKKADSYEKYAADATLGAEVTALLAAVDDTTKSDAEIAAMFTSLDEKLEVVALIDEVEQYIADNASAKDTANLTYVLVNLKNAQANSGDVDAAIAQLNKVYEAYKTPSTSMLYSHSFSYDFSAADMEASKASVYTGTSLDTTNQQYVMATNDSGLGWHSRNALGTSTHISSGVVTTSAKLSFSSNTANYPKALMLCSGEQANANRDVPLIGLAARDDGYFYLYLTMGDEALGKAIRLGTYSANTPYDIKLVADLDNKVGEVYINGVKQATDGPVLLDNSTVYYVASSRAGEATFAVDDILVNVDIMKNKIAFSDKDEVTSNLTLPVTTTDGYPIRWTTNNASVVAADGTVTVPVQGSATAVLTADVLCGEKTASYSYVVNVGNTRTLYRSHRFTVESDVVKMNVNLANVTAAPKDAISYLVVINEATKEIVDVDVAAATVSVAAGAAGYLTNEVSVPDDDAAYLVRGFVWDSNLIPLTTMDATLVSELN